MPKSPKIRQLPPNLVNQIAAGEVIERPASVVKELLENSIDAGARRVEVVIEQGGTELIRISDDGCGMDANELPLAVTSHATSKLPDDTSLFRVTTFGFRGEALASIGSVSHLTLRSRVANSDAGAELRVRGGVLESPAPCGCPVGTAIEVRNLFFNTPVRRKFLRTAQTENGHIVEAFTRLALANPQVHMVLKSNDREIHDLPPTERWADRIAAFFDSDIADALIGIDSNESQIHISGYACDPSASRANNRMQYLFLNGRYIRDRSLQHALGEAYRGLLMVGRHPVCFLRVNIPPEMVDVNVHPSKLEVRFTDSGQIYGRVLQTLRHKFLSTDMTYHVGSTREPTDDPATTDSIPENANPPSVTDGGLGTIDTSSETHRQNVIQWAQTGTTPVASNLGGVAPFRPFDGPSDPTAPLQRTTTPTPSESNPLPGPVPATPQHSLDTDPDSANHHQNHDSHTSHLGFQVHQRYLITQDEKGMVVIDQHALHERVLYEQIRDKVLQGEIETQQLLIPEPVSLTPSEYALALESKPLFAKVGIQIEPFGGDTMLVQSYPAMLANVPPGQMLQQLLESLASAGKNPDIRDLLDHLLHSIACKAAIKAGDRLAPEEITSLLEQRELYADTHHCPHGRPTALFFSRDELDRMFGRLGPRSKTNPSQSQGIQPA